MMTFSRMSQNVLHGNVCNPGLNQPVFAHQQALSHCQASVEDVVEVLGESPDMKSEDLMEYLDKEEFNEGFSPENCFENISSPTDSRSFFTDDMFRSSGFGVEQRPSQDFYGTPHRQQTIDNNSTFMNFPSLPGMSNQQHQHQQSFYPQGAPTINNSPSLTTNFGPVKYEMHESSAVSFPLTLTPEELRKKLKNNHACKMSRNRRREQKIYMENRARELTDENRELRMQIVRLENEKQRIKQLILDHHRPK